MAVLIDKKNNELILTCGCGCDDALHICVDKYSGIDETSFFMTYMNGKFYSEQDKTWFRIFKDKMKRVRAILFNKDYYYSDIMMEKEDWEIFKDFVNRN